MEVPNPEHGWHRLPRPLKVGVLTFLVGLIWMGLSGLLYDEPLFALFSCSLWGAGAGSLIRLRDRIRDRGGRR